MRNQPSENVSSSSPLDWLEYLALIGSVAGTVAVIAGKSVALAATPLSLAILINFANRRRIDQLSLQNSRAARVQMQELSEQLQSFQQEVRNLPVGDALAAGSGAELQSLQASLGHLQHQYDGFQSTINSVTERLQQAPSGEALFSLENSISALSTSLRSYDGRLTTLEQAPSPSAPSVVEAPDLGQLRADLDASLHPIREQIESLQAKLTETPAVANPEGMASLENTLADLSAKLNNYGDRLHTGV